MVRRLVAARDGKTPWSVPVLGRWEKDSPVNGTSAPVFRLMSDS
jgi:hypothetical protein